MYNQLKSADGSEKQNLRCPRCRHAGAFRGVGSADINWLEGADVHGHVSWAAGMRKCPNPGCDCLVFVVLRRGKLNKTYPPEVIDFDSTNLPAPILASFEEAIRAHSAECFKASALMVRRVLEEVCQDKKATGKDLKARIRSLGGNIIMSYAGKWVMTE